MVATKSYRTVTCQKCGQNFIGGPNAQYCPTCKPIQRLQRGREREARLKGTRVSEGPQRCPICGGFKNRHSERCAHCFHNAERGEHNVNWKGGRTRTRDGYIAIRESKKGRKHPYILEHRLVWEQMHGELPEGYVVHHLNGVKDDNRLENLFALPRNVHTGPELWKALTARIRQLEAQLRELSNGLQGKLAD